MMLIFCLKNSRIVFLVRHHFNNFGKETQRKEERKEMCYKTIYISFSCRVKLLSAELNINI